MTANPQFLDYLKTRRSVTLPFLAAPGPDPDQLQELLSIGARVPDHGKLVPWRYVIFDKEARARAGARLADIIKKRDVGISKAALEAERNRFLPAPVTIGVVSAAGKHPKVPEIEQQLTAGCVCLNLLHGANALGFAAQWVTRWYAFDPEAAQMLGANQDEFFAGFIHIGTPERRLPDRDRPNVEMITRYWSG